jgi:hypothetical protein
MFKKFYKHAHASHLISLKQFKALWLAAHDYTNCEIARILRLTDDAVEKINKRLCYILDAHHMKGAIHRAWQKKILNEVNG